VVSTDCRGFRIYLCRIVTFTFESIVGGYGQTSGDLYCVFM
jgi:hypothetical protein